MTVVGTLSMAMRFEVVKCVWRPGERLTPGLPQAPLSKNGSTPSRLLRGGGLIIAPCPATRPARPPTHTVAHTTFHIVIKLGGAGCSAASSPIFFFFGGNATGVHRAQSADPLEARDELSLAPKVWDIQGGMSLNVNSVIAL